ncbi:rCG48639, isoform CRA_b [Rattus norvegicus]|uniref:RCG48639, isoform CRA_b n=1 Tax=Rattus norvegicus TaxID=10116 RepID=A6IFG9_RAT|nr:rCG48639, isoform CRA_b [Rattus norvegicus]
MRKKKPQKRTAQLVLCPQLVNRRPHLK